MVGRQGFECPAGGTAACDPATLPESLHHYGGFGRPYFQWLKNAVGTYTWSKRVTFFDAAGRTIRQTTWLPEAADPTTGSATVSSGHDAYGRPSTITLPDGKVQTQSFVGIRQRNRFAPVATALDGTETVFRTTETYDRNGRLVQLEEPAMAGDAYANAAYTYNVLGGLFRIVHTAGADVQQRTWVYDGRGLLVSESSPERVSLVELGNYDAAGNAGRRTVAGNVLDFAFDRAGRLLTTSRPLGGGGSELLQQLTYDTAPGYGIGRIASATNWTRFSGAAVSEARVTEAFEYSGVGGNASLHSTTVALDGTTAASTSHSYVWSALGAIAELGYPTGMSPNDPARTVTHEYTNGFLTAIPGYASSLTYHDNFALASVAHAKGVTDWIGQDPSRMLRPAALWTSGVANDEDWNSGAYGYDGSGNIRAIGGQRYRYDGVSRLVEAELRIPETSQTLFGVESFTYDAYGNLVSRDTTDPGGSVTVHTPADPATNRLTGATSYDSEGNMTGWNGAQYGFDPLGRMARMQNGAEDWLFAYSTDGERVLQVSDSGVGEKRWTMRDVAGRVLREWIEPQGGATTWDRDWIYRGGQLLATVDATKTRHLTLDHLGTPRLVTDQAGVKLAFHAYWPFGREATDPNQDGLRKRFTGHERDDFGTSSTADDLDYMHARFANPASGRFLSIDPLRGSPTRPQSLNLFTYTWGNPLRWADPYGMQPGATGGPPPQCTDPQCTVTAPYPPPLPPNEFCWWCAPPINPNDVEGHLPGHLIPTQTFENPRAIPPTGPRDRLTKLPAEPTNPIIKPGPPAGCGAGPSDYISLSIDIGIPVALDLSFTLDRNGNLYFGLGASSGQSILGGNVTAVSGGADVFLSEEDLNSSISGWATKLTVGGGLAGGIAIPSNGNVMQEFGLSGPPSAGGSFGHTWQIPFTVPSLGWSVDKECYGPAANRE